MPSGAQSMSVGHVASEKALNGFTFRNMHMKRDSESGMRYLSSRVQAESTRRSLKHSSTAPTDKALNCNQFFAALMLAKMHRQQGTWAPGASRMTLCKCPCPLTSCTRSAEAPLPERVSSLCDRAQKDHMLTEVTESAAMS